VKRYVYVAQHEENPPARRQGVPRGFPLVRRDRGGGRARPQLAGLCRRSRFSVVSTMRATDGRV